MAGEQRRLNNLCEALGISIDQSDSSKWEQVGRILAEKHPAHVEKRKGRPKGAIAQSLDHQRLKFIEIICELHTPGSDEATVTMIKEYKSEDPEVQKKLNRLFGGSMSTILSSISRARAEIARWRKAIGR